ncbi:MAG TPA: ribosome-associated translation inhibitor RaiA [Candidatus Paceibacterota bacterium]
MRINIKATGIELTPSISEYATKKVSMLEKYLRDNPDVVTQVEVGKITQHHKSGEVFRAEVHITGAGIDLYAANEQADLYAAIDVVKDEVAETLIQKRGRRESLTRRGARRIKDALRSWNPFS